MVIGSLFTHHLSENDIVRFLRWMENHAEIGWFVNDLSRAATPYHFIHILAKLIRLHPFVQYDAPVSIARPGTNFMPSAVGKSDPGGPKSTRQIDPNDPKNTLNTRPIH